MKTKSTAAASGELATWLTGHGFTFEDRLSRLSGDADGRWFCRDRVRVIAGDDGTVAICVFDERRPQLGCCEWQARVDGAPLAAITDFVTAALGGAERTDMNDGKIQVCPDCGYATGNYWHIIHATGYLTAAQVRDSRFGD